MKVCSVCNIENNVGAFAKKRNGHQSRCRDCQSIYSKEHYANNKVSYAERNTQARIKLRKFVFDYYLAHPCIDCGESDPVVLEFDHVRDKHINVSHAIRNKWSVERLTMEISKCEVRCANCHRRKTARDFGWYRDLE